MIKTFQIDHKRLSVIPHNILGIHVLIGDTFYIGKGLTGTVQGILRVIQQLTVFIQQGSNHAALLFCLCAALLAFLMAMRSENGALGTGEILLSLLGLLAYFRLLSPLFLPAFDSAAAEIGVLLSNTQVFAKKFVSRAKKLFQKSRG